MTQNTPFQTNYHSPWALVSWGGYFPGKRPLTRLGFITNAVARDGRLVKFKVITLSAASGQWTKTPRCVPLGAIYKTWRSYPSPDTIKKAKRALPPNPTSGEMAATLLAKARP